MEGVMLKWINYFSGWQPRYFALKGLFLTYYLCKEDAGKEEAAEGSMKMALCEIKVHRTDRRRFDLQFPGEQILCLKVLSCGDRQRWLVALGSAKACLLDIHPKEETELTQNDACLWVKLCELQLCCHLVVQHVNMLQGCAWPMEDQAQSVFAASSSLRDTCSNFIGTLESCMKTCRCGTVAQPPSVAPPVSRSAVVRPRQQQRLLFTFPEGADVDSGCMQLGSEALSGQTVKRSIAEMAFLHIQRRSTGHGGHKGAHFTVPNNGASDVSNEIQRRGRAVEVKYRGSANHLPS
ncbi:hypothetical protein GJAV_G00191740 [Gymnothorax javanicus]|nr:hypothetical protein GJAV_G00191740 [Gymnothorax javanicus]